MPTTIDIDSPYTVSGARWLLCYDPEADRVYTFAGIGPGSPEPVFRGRHPNWSLPVEAVVEDVEAWVEANVELIAATADDPDGMAWAAVSHELGRAVNDAELRSYWDAGDWYDGDVSSVVEQALEHPTVEAAAIEERNRAATERVVLRQDDAERALRELLENALDGCDEDDEDEMTRAAGIRRLLEGE